AGVRVHHATTITQIKPGPGRDGGGGAWTAAGHDRYGDPWSADCDGVVLVTQQASDDGLYLELAGDPVALAAAGIGAVHRIGDAVAPRMLSEAIFDGHRLAREIDAPDPATPLPYRREPTGPGEGPAPSPSPGHHASLRVGVPARYLTAPLPDWPRTNYPGLGRLITAVPLTNWQFACRGVARRGTTCAGCLPGRSRRQWTLTVTLP